MFEELKNYIELHQNTQNNSLYWFGINIIYFNYEIIKIQTPGGILIFDYLRMQNKQKERASHKIVPRTFKKLKIDIEINQHTDIMCNYFVYDNNLIGY